MNLPIGAELETDYEVAGNRLVIHAGGFEAPTLRRLNHGAG